MLTKIVKNLFGNTNYGIYHRRGYGFLAAGYAVSYINPIASIPAFAAAGYSFVQAIRYKPGMIEEFKKKRNKISKII